MTRGNYYKMKTKKWLEGEGYVCEYLEKTQRLFSRDKVLHVKHDLFGADLLAMNGEDIVFVQVKSGKEKTGISVKKVRDEFSKYPFPPSVKKWLVIWRERQREPEIIEITAEGGLE